MGLIGLDLWANKEQRVGYSVRKRIGRVKREYK